MYEYTSVAATTAAVANRFVTTTNMIAAAYTLANTTPVWGGGCLVTVTHTTVAGADTLGTIVVVGKDLAGQTITDTITPLAGTVATGTKIFRSLTTVTGVGWVAVSTADTIVVGCAAGSYPVGGGGVLHSVIVNTTAAAAVVISDAKGTIATLPSSATVGTYYYDVAVAGYLKVATTSTNDLTITHSGSMPQTFAT